MGCSPTEIGEFRSRIIIQSRSRASDGMGGGTITWSTFATVWANIEPKTGNEAFWARHLEHRVTHEITIRYLANVTSDMRISFGSRIFQIKGIINWQEKNRLLVLKCIEGVAA